MKLLKYIITPSKIFTGHHQTLTFNAIIPLIPQVVLIAVQIFW